MVNLLEHSALQLLRRLRLRSVGSIDNMATCFGLIFSSTFDSGPASFLFMSSSDEQRQKPPTTTPGKHERWHVAFRLLLRKPFTAFGVIGAAFALLCPGLCGFVF